MIGYIKKIKIHLLIMKEEPSNHKKRYNNSLVWCLKNKVRKILRINKKKLKIRIIKIQTRK